MTFHMNLYVCVFVSKIVVQFIIQNVGMEHPYRALVCSIRVFIGKGLGGASSSCLS